MTDTRAPTIEDDDADLVDRAHHVWISACKAAQDAIVGPLPWDVIANFARSVRNEARARTGAEVVVERRYNFVGFLARWAKDDKLSFEERVSIIANHPYVRALDGKSPTTPAGETVERPRRYIEGYVQGYAAAEAAMSSPDERARAEFAAELRKWWSFDDRQMHTHSWHSREDFIERKLPSLLAMSSPDERAIAEEREACAKIAQEIYDSENQLSATDEKGNIELHALRCARGLTAKVISDRIRARGPATEKE